MNRFTPESPARHTMSKTMYAERDPMIARGELYSACLDPVVGSEQGGVRPVLVVQNDVGNKYSPTIIVAAITSKKNKADLPTHVAIDADGNGLSKNSIILMEQLRTIDKRRLKERIGTIDKTRLPEVNEALSVSLGIDQHSFF